MSSFVAEGKLYKVFNVVQVSDKFKKRELVLEMVDGAYTQLIKFQLVQDNCAKLDAFKVGDDVSVSFNLRGREWTDPQGEVKYFSNLDAWKIDPLGSNVAAPIQSAPSKVASAPSKVGDNDLPF